MYMNNQKWRLIYMYIYMCVDISYVHIFFQNVIFIVVNLKLDVEQYIYIYFFITISFRLTMINFTLSEYICIHTYIYTLCFAVILTLYRIFIIVRYFDILLLYKKYIASRYIFNSVLSIS